MLVLGIIGAGGRFTGCNPAYTASELGHQIRLTRARFLITEPEVLSKVATAVESFALSPSSVFVLDNTDKEIPIHWNSIQDLFKHGETDWVKCQTVEEARHTTAALLLTSGTTGLPKAARISHYCFVMMNLTLNDSARKPYEVRCSSARVTGIEGWLTAMVGVKTDQPTHVPYVCLPTRTYCAAA